MKKIILLSLVLLFSCDSKKTDVFEKYPMIGKRIQFLLYFEKMVAASNLNEKEKESLSNFYKKAIKKVLKTSIEQNKIMSALIKDLHLTDKAAKKEVRELGDLYWKVNLQRAKIVSKYLKKFTNKIQGHISKEKLDKIYQELLEKGLIYIEVDEK